MTCTACTDRSRCLEKFTCHHCERHLNVCRERVGGLESPLVPECTRCYERRVFGPVWVDGWSAENTPYGQRQEALVVGAQSYQERNG